MSSHSNGGQTQLASTVSHFQNNKKHGENSFDYLKCPQYIIVDRSIELGQFHSRENSRLPRNWPINSTGLTNQSVMHKFIIVVPRDFCFFFHFAHTHTHTRFTWVILICYWWELRARPYSDCINISFTHTCARCAHRNHCARETFVFFFISSFICLCFLQSCGKYDEYALRYVGW